MSVSELSAAFVADGGGGRVRRGPLRRLRGNKTLAVGAALVVLAALAALVVPLLDPEGATRINAGDALAPPLSSHVLGTDQLGRDLLVRLAAGYRISLAVSVGAVALALVVGMPIGLVAAMGPPWLSASIMRGLDVVMAFPPLLLAVVVVALVGPGTGTLILAIGLVYTPIIVRVMRASALEASQEAFVDAARARGASFLRIVLRHVAPNSLGPVLVQASILMSVCILLEAALSFIGLGVRPPTPSLGLMLSSGRDFMASSPWVVAVPGLAILVVVLGITLVGDGLQDLLDPKKRSVAR